MVVVPVPSKTPLTDAVVLPVRQSNDLTYERLVKHARKLERDRAELLDLLVEARKWMDGDLMNDPWEKAFCEKIDAAIKAVKAPA